MQNKMMMTPMAYRSLLTLGIAVEDPSRLRCGAERCGQVALVICGRCGGGSCDDARHIFDCFVTARGGSIDDSRGSRFHYYCTQCRDFVCKACLGLVTPTFDLARLEGQIFGCPACDGDVLIRRLDSVSAADVAEVILQFSSRMLQVDFGPTEMPPSPGHAPVASLGEARVHPQDGSVLVRVPAGPFTFGSDAADVRRFFLQYKLPLSKLEQFLDETPIRTIDLPEFWISKYAITNAQFTRYLVDSGRAEAVDLTEDEAFNYGRFFELGPDEDFGRYPVSGISYTEASAYCRWAGLALPSEAQWEKAARGTDRRVFPWGDDYQADLANTLETSAPFPDSIYVDALPDNVSPYGCIQMTGNVSEWCMDWYDATWYRHAAGHEGPPTGKFRVLRGGSTERPFVYARVTSRDYADPTSPRNFAGGFRPVWNGRTDGR